MDKKCIVVGVTGGIAAYKSVQLVSDLLKKGYDVEVVMSKNACEFIQPLTFSSLTKHNTLVDTFERTTDWSVEHIALAKRADLFIIAPATANIIGKIAGGIADDFLSTTVMAAKCPVIIAPAMNTNMYENPIVQENIDKLKRFGYHFVEPETGLLACEDIGKGKLANIPTLMDACEYYLSEKPLLGKKVLISAGPTIEYIDPVRFISNPSTGKMGYSLARVARNLGAEVTLVHGPTQLALIPFIKDIAVTSAQEMFEYFKVEAVAYDFIIKTAAVSDYHVSQVSEQKLKKTSQPLTLTLEENPDILAYLGKHKQPHQVLCGFAMESERLEEYAEAKRIKKRVDMIVANNIKEAGAGFGVDTNRVTILDGETHKLPLASKEALAYEILMRMLEKSK
ncbi:MAG: bifunctional phosphopantothenoylcysteine decarboxylase/phosphopantothenate--cysteine ligase CoaBC [Erysipelotrichaceae bacterium]